MFHTGSPPVSASNHNTSNKQSGKIELTFGECHWYEITCPYPECVELGKKFDCHGAFKNHHESTHCLRDIHGDIIKNAASRWKCHAEIDIDSDNSSSPSRKRICGKVSNSWYNYAGHITSHINIVGHSGHSWGCLLPPSGPRKKTNTLINGKLVCGKRTSTKHHLIAHIKNVHKQYQVIDKNGRRPYTRSNNNKRTRKRNIIDYDDNHNLHALKFNTSNENENDVDSNNEPPLKKPRFELPPMLSPISAQQNNNNNNNNNKEQLIIPNSKGRKCVTLQQQKEFILALLDANHQHNCNECRSNAVLTSMSTSLPPLISDDKSSVISVNSSISSNASPISMVLPMNNNNNNPFNINPLTTVQQNVAPTNININSCQLALKLLIQRHHLQQQIRNKIQQQMGVQQTQQIQLLNPLLNRLNNNNISFNQKNNALYLLNNNLNKM